MARRLELHELLCSILGSRNVYYQPPASIQMQYPAIIYSRKDIYNRNANDKVYKQDLAYDLTVIDSNPDSKIVEEISRLPMCSFDRRYTADYLYHDVFTIYY